MKIERRGKEVELEPLSVKEGEETVELTPKTLWSIESVYVVPPPDRDGDLGFIHGQISFTDDLAKPAVTLFSRPEDDPQSVYLGDPDLGFLTLAQDPAQDRPLDGLHPIYVNIHLFESKPKKVDPELGKGKEDEEEDEEYEEIEIANVKGHMMGREVDLWKVEGKCGFTFLVRYASFTGLRVQFEVRINSEIWLPDPKSPKCNIIRGLFAACQDKGPGSRKSDLTMFLRLRREPESVPVGSPIPLDRSVVVGPCAPGLLSIAVVLWYHQPEHLVGREYYDFPIEPVNGVVVTNKQCTHTKHGFDGLVSVSIKFIQ